MNNEIELEKLVDMLIHKFHIPKKVSKAEVKIIKSELLELLEPENTYFFHGKSFPNYPLLPKNDQTEGCLFSLAVANKDGKDPYLVVGNAFGLPAEMDYSQKVIVQEIVNHFSGDRTINFSYSGNLKKGGPYIKDFSFYLSRQEELSFLASCKTVEEVDIAIDTIISMQKAYTNYFRQSVRNFLHQTR